MSENELTPQKSFEENIKEKLRKDIGDLLPDSVLSKMVERAMEDMFFTKEKRLEGWNTREYPSFLQQQVKELMNLKVKQEIDNYFSKNENEMTAMIAKSISDNAPQLLASFIIGIFSEQVQKTSWEMMNHLRDELSRAGRL